MAQDHSEIGEKDLCEYKDAIGRGDARGNPPFRSLRPNSRQSI